MRFKSADLLKFFLLFSLSTIDCRARSRSSSLSARKNAKKDEFPYLTVVLSYDPDPKDGAFFGTGSILNNKWIITARHVVFNLEPNSEFYDGMVLVLPKYDNNYRKIVDKKKNNAYLVVKKFCYPRRRNESEVFTDFTLLKLHRTIHLKKRPNNFQAIKIPNPRTVNWNSKLELAGWGEVNSSVTGDLSDYLRTSEFKIEKGRKKHELCDLKDKLFCATAKKEGACFGNFGGPAVIKNRKTSTHELVGLTTTIGQNCTFMSVFVNLTTHKAWIENVIKKEPKNLECRNILRKNKQGARG